MFENEDEMIIYLHDLARETSDEKLRQIADTLSHLVKHEKSKKMIQETFEHRIHFG